MSKRVYYSNIEKDTIKNNKYRDVLYTIPSKMQLVLMSLNPGEDIPKEIHKTHAQFIRVESGSGEAVVGKTSYKLKDGISIIIPPGREHYIRNTSKTKKLKLYTIYTPPEHPPTRKNARQPKN